MIAPPHTTPRIRQASAAETVGLWDADLVAGLFYGDAQVAEIYGVDPAIAAAGVRREAFTDLIHPDDAAIVAGEMRALLTGAPEYTVQHRVIRPGGAVRQVLSRGRVVRNAAGRPMRLAGVCVDVTERRRTEARQAILLEIIDRLRSSADPRTIVHDAVAHLGQHLGASRAGFGEVQPDDATIVVETTYADGVPPLRGAFPMEAFGTGNVTRHRQGLTIVHAGLDGDTKGGIRAFVSVPLIRDGKLRATVFVSRRDAHDWAPNDVRLIEGVARRLWDAMERARAEEALRNLNASLEREVAARTRDRDRTWRLAPLVMAISSPDGRLLTVNPAWTRLLGWSPAETVGQGMMRFVPPEHREAAAATMARLSHGELLDGYTVNLLAKSGEHRCLLWTTVSEDGQLYLYGRDVTDQMVAEDRLRQAQKMEAVGQLTGGLAHDFNNLLTGIMGSLDLMQARLRQGRLADLETYIELGQGAARRAAALTHRLLAFSRRQSLDPRPTGVNGLVEGMRDLIRHAAGPAVEIRIRAAAPCTALVDPHQLENALLNLCNNGRDAMPDGGVLDIETAPCTLDDAAARDLGIGPGRYVVLSVTDTGRGMTPEIVRRAFDPFFTTKPIGAGTGLGLSMIYGFARQSGGAARIVSAPGQGTSVSIYMPRAAGSGGDAEPAGLAAAVTRAESNETVLVAHADPAMRAQIAEMLGTIGYAAAEAADGPAALRILQAGIPVHLLVAGTALPGLAGPDLAAAGHAARPGLRVLLIAGAGEDPGKRSGAVLAAPFSTEAFASRIAALVSGA